MLQTFTFSGGRQGTLPVAAFEVFDFTEKKWRKLPDIPSKRVFAMYTHSDTHIFSLGKVVIDMYCGNFSLRFQINK